MLSVTIDPAVFAPPFGARTPESVRAYVDTLLHWKRVHDEGHVALFAAERTAEILVTSNCYPLRPWLTDLLRETRFVEFDANTIASFAETLIGKSESLEKAIRITDLLSEQVSVAPDIFNEHIPPELREASEKTALMIAIVRKARSDSFTSSHGMVVRKRDSASEVLMKAIITILEYEGEDLAYLPELPNEFEGRSVICERFHDYLMAVDEGILWQKALGNEGLERSIWLAAYKSRAKRGEPDAWNTRLPLRINPQFYASVVSYGAQENPVVARGALRAILETIESTNMADTHQLRTGNGPNDREVTRGDDIAWRRDVDYEHHLHYWICPGGLIELSCLSYPHDNFTIYR
jgi:hypothetical protein